MKKVLDIGNVRISEVAIVTGFVVAGILVAPRMTITACLAYQLGKARDSKENKINQEEESQK